MQYFYHLLMNNILNSDLIHYSPITTDQRSIEKGMVIFSVKDRDLLGFSNQYIAECFLPFTEIENRQPTEQIHLKLSRPKNSGELSICIFFYLFYQSINNIYSSCYYQSNQLFIIKYRVLMCSFFFPSDCPYVNALKLREGDKLAKEFMKKLKQKLPSS